jgi:hypothetical protein
LIIEPRQRIQMRTVADDQLIAIECHLELIRVEEVRASAREQRHPACGWLELNRHVLFNTLDVALEAQTFLGPIRVGLHALAQLFSKERVKQRTTRAANASVEVDAQQGEPRRFEARK